MNAKMSKTNLWDIQNMPKAQVFFTWAFNDIILKKKAQVEKSCAILVVETNIVTCFSKHES